MTGTATAAASAAPMTTLRFLCAGAAQGVIRALQPAFESSQHCTLQGRFGAVGAMKDALLGGEPCDLLVSTESIVDALVADGRVRPAPRAAMGRVRTGIAVRRGTVMPDVTTASALRKSLLAADAIYFPDPQRATAGIHFARVLRELGIHDGLMPRMCTFPNGATAMRELAGSRSPQPIGCTQVTEILYTEGVELVGMLPPQFELATVYTAAVAADAAQPELAAQLAALLGDAASADLRRSGGFEF